MAAFQLFNGFIESGFKGSNLGTDALHWVPLSSVPSVSITSNTEIEAIEIAHQYGYDTIFDIPVPTVSATQTGGVFSLVIDVATVTATGGSIGPFRAFALIPGTGAPIGFFDYGTDYTLPDGQTFTIQGGTVFTASA